MSRKRTESDFKRSLWISVEEMLTDDERAEIGLRFEQSPHLWMVRLCSAASEKFRAPEKQERSE